MTSKVHDIWIDKYLQDNLDIFVKEIARDNHFLFIITGSGEVRIGKSTIAQQIAWYLTQEANRKHGWNNTFDLSNIVFNAEQLFEVSANKPKGSVIIMDEGDDTIDHYASKLTRDIRTYFRKCGVLNQFVIVIIPDFFDLPKFFALSRSAVLINVDYKKNSFDKGRFYFYSKYGKKMLYFLGKKYSDYNAWKSDFYGDFQPKYLVDRDEYNKKKEEDLNDKEKRGRNYGGDTKYFNRNTAYNAIRYLKEVNKLTWKEIAKTVLGNEEEYKSLSTIYMRDFLRDTTETGNIEVNKTIGVNE